MTSAEQVTLNELARKFDTFLTEEWRTFRADTVATLRELKDDKLRRDTLSEASAVALSGHEQDAARRKALAIALTSGVFGALATVIAALIAR